MKLEAVCLNYRALTTLALIAGTLLFSACGSNPATILSELRIGTVDTSFGIEDGFTHFVDGAGSSAAEVNQIEVDGLGRILIVAKAGGLMGAPEAMALIRLLPNGQYDTTFGDPDGGGGRLGYVSRVFAGRDTTGTGLFVTDTEIYVVGSTDTPGGTDDWVIWRFDHDGQNDTTFGFGDGFGARVGYNSGPIATSAGRWSVYAKSVVASSAGVFISGGIERSGEEPMVFVQRFGPDGVLDVAWPLAGGGVFAQQVNHSQVGDMILSHDGNLLIADTDRQPPTYNFNMMVWKINSATGALVPGFGLGGVGYAYYDSPENGYELAKTVYEDAAGKIYVVGGGGLVRFNSNGQLDVTFGSNGRAQYQSELFGEPGYVLVTRWNSILERPGGGFFVSGTAGNGDPDGQFTVVALNADGTLDTSFGGSGAGYTQIPIGMDGYAKVTRIAFDINGDIVGAGPSELSSMGRGLSVFRLSL